MTKAGVIGGAEVLDRAASADRHETRRDVCAVGGSGYARPRSAIYRGDFQTHRMHQAAPRSSSIASPKLSNVVHGRWKLVNNRSTACQL